MSLISVVRDLGGTGLPERIVEGTVGRLGYSTATYSQSASPTAADPIDLLLKILISLDGSGRNDPPSGAYDVLPEGAGLGIPHTQLDVASFTNIKAQDDWASSQQLLFLLPEPEPAHEFIVREICRPFGLYLAVRNDGRIRCIRPRHPQHFYIGETNRNLKIGYPTGAPPVEVQIHVGVYSATELADQIYGHLVGTFGSASLKCEYDIATAKFKISKEGGSNFDLIVPSSDNGWKTLGWETTTTITNTASEVAPNQRGTFTSETLTPDDMWRVEVLDNRADQIEAVGFAYDYSFEKDRYRSTRWFTDSNAALQSDNVGESAYWIHSRGLTSKTSSATIIKPPASGCIPQLLTSTVDVSAAGWAELHAKTLLKRYVNPPIKFRAKLRWKWNHLEVGDVVRVTYDIPGVFVDYERNLSTLTNRLFEIVHLQPNFDGSLEATFLGHRYVSY